MRGQWLRIAAILLSAALAQASFGDTLSPEPAARDHHCFALGQIASWSIGYRNAGASPQQAYSVIGAPKNLEQFAQVDISEEQVKDMINSMYFDTEMRDAAPSIGGTIYQMCLGIIKPYTPLK